MAINSLNASSHGLSGLVSGMNTQEMVDKMLSGTQAKIDKAGQKKTSLQYKQSMYREAVNKLRTIQSGFLSFTSKVNLLSNGFYNTMAGTVTPPSGTSAAFSVTASSSAKVGNYTMEHIEQLATARTGTSSKPASGKVAGNFDKTMAQSLLNDFTGDDAKMTIKIGDESITISDVTKEFGGKNGTDIADIINTAFQNKATAEGKNVLATARFVNNKLEIIADDPEKYVVLEGNTGAGAKNKTLGMRMFGDGVTTMSGQGTFSHSINSDTYMPGFNVNLDGREQVIRLNVKDLEDYVNSDTDANFQKLAQSVNSQMKRFFGTGVQLKQDSPDHFANGQFEFVSAGVGQKFTITGNSKVMGAMGLKTGVSNKLNSTMTLNDLNFATTLQGSRHTFSINGVQFSFESSTSLNNVMDTINSSRAGVKISFNESSDLFTIRSSETGEGMEAFTFDQSEGNLLSAMFGVAGGSSTVGAPVHKKMTGDVITSEVLDDIKRGGNFQFNLNGRDYSFAMNWKLGDDEYTAETFATKMNEKFASTFGIKPDGTQAVTFKLTSDNRFEIESNNPDFVIKIAEKDADKNKSLLGFGVGDSTLVKSGTATWADIGLNFASDAKMTMKVGSKTIVVTGAELNAIDTLSPSYTKDMNGLAAYLSARIADEPGADMGTVTYDEHSAAFRIAGVGVPMEIMIEGGTVNGDATDSANLDKIFGGSVIKAGQAAEAGAYTEVAGQNAKFKLNGVEMERASNSFTVDGITYTLFSDTKVRDANGDPTGQYEKTSNISVTRDTEKIVEGIREFLKTYNETIDFLNDFYKSDPTYKKYAPLTQKQKEAMSDREIELWEEKSKEGLLRNDAHIGKVLESMRKALYTKPEGSSIAIYDLGISTSYYSKDGNFVESAGDNMKAAIEKDPDAVRNLFAGEGGIMELLNTAINDAISGSFGSQGYIVAEAGTSTIDSNSSIYKQIKQIDDQLGTLEKRYWNEYNRYWKQFTSMEKLISQMNSQSTWLNQQFSGGM